MVNELNKNMVKELKKESETWEIRKNLQYVGNMVKEERVFVDGKWVNKTPHKNQFWNGERYNLSTKTKSFRLFCGEGRNIDDVIKSDADFRRVFKLMNCMNDNNQIMYADNKKKAVPMNREIRTRVFGMTQNKVGEFLSRMKKVNVIKEDGMGNFFINPVYTMANRGITVKVFLLFRKELEQILNENAIKDLQTLAYYDLHPEILAQEMEEQKKTLEELLIDGRQYDAINEYDNNLDPKTVTKEQEDAKTIKEVSDNIRNYIRTSSKTSHLADQIIVKEEVLLEVLQNEFNNRPIAMAISPISNFDMMNKKEEATLADIVNNCSFLQGIDLETGEVLDFVPVEVTANSDVTRVVTVIDAINRMKNRFPKKTMNIPPRPSIKKEITNPIILNDVSEEDDIYDFVNKLNNKYKEIA